MDKIKQIHCRQSTFLRLAPQSVVVDKTQKVIVEKNVMPVNAFEAVYAKDGSHLMISCNRLIGKPISPECTWTTPSTTTTTTTTTTPLPYLINQGSNSIHLLFGLNPKLIQNLFIFFGKW